jgi:RNA polymerase sigma-70 factor (ECF subfamily)
VALVTATTFEGVFDEHGSSVFAYLLRRTNREDAEDLLSETFLTFWRKYGGHQMPAEPLPFLLAIARRLLANQRRAEARRSALKDRIAREPAPELADLPDQLAGTGVLEALAQLSEPDREVLLLDAWEQLSGPEAARVLGCREGTYRQRLRRARERMASLMEQAGGAPLQPDGATTGGRQ